jgi:hypothetical protein
MSRVYPYDLPTSFFRFVGEDLQELRPTRVVYTFSGVTAGQSDYVQVFMDDGSIAVDEVTGQLVVEVSTLVGDLSV